jgi:hypothetical protein
LYSINKPRPYPIQYCLITEHSTHTVLMSANSGTIQNGPTQLVRE